MLANPTSTEVKVLCLAAALLFAGALLYVLDRGNAVFFLGWWPFGPIAPAALGPLGDHLPTLLHAIVFILITAAVLRPWPGSLPAVCIAWFAVECAFEFGQADAFAERIAASMPSWFGSVPLLRNTADYFVRGTFDPLDVLSIAIGTAAAYPIARKLLQGDLR